MRRVRFASVLAIASIGLAGLGNSGCLFDSSGLGSATGGAGGSSSSTGDSGGAGGSTPCSDGQIQACYSGPSGSKDVGACKGGQQTCSNKEWGPCEGEIVPVVDSICDGIDSACDGKDDISRGCAAYEVQDTCQGVLLLRNNVIVLEGSSPNNEACFNGTVRGFLNPGDDVYILEDDDTSVIKLWNTQPLSIGSVNQNKNATFDHLTMFAQFQAGGFTANGLTVSMGSIPGGNEYTLVYSGNGQRHSFALSF